MSQAGGPERLLLGYRVDDGVAVVKVTGDIDVSTSGLLRDGLLQVTGENRHCLVVNLAGVNFLDSTGVGVLVGIWHRVRAAKGSIALAAPSRQARRTLEVTGLTSAFSVYDTEAEAVQACSQPGSG